LTIINAGQAILDDAQAQIDALPTEKVVNITVTTNAPAVAAETAEATTAESADIDATIEQLLAGNSEFETQFQLAMVTAQQAIGKTAIALDGLAAAEAESGPALTELGVGEEAVAVGGDTIMASMQGMLATLAPIAALFGIGLGVKATLDIMEQQTQATAALNNAFKDVKTSIPTSELDTLSTKMSNMGFNDVEVTQSLTNLTLATKSGSKAVTDESAAADLAAYSHISLTAATNQLIKGSQGQARALKTLALDGLVPVINNEKAMAAAHAAVGTAQDALTKNTNSLTNAQVAYAAAVAKYGPDSAEAEKADRSLQNAQISHQAAVDKLSTANTNLTNKEKDLADPTWQMSQLTDELHTKIGGLAQAQSQTLGGAFDIVKAKVEDFLGSAGQNLQKWFTQHQGQIVSVASTIWTHLIGAWNAYTGVISTVVRAISGFYTSHKKILDDIAGLIVHDIIQYWKDVISIMGLVVTAIEDFYDKNKAVIDNVVNVVLAALKIALEVIGWTLSNVVVPAFKIGLDIISTALQIVINIIETVVDVIQDIVGVVQYVVKETSAGFAQIGQIINTIIGVATSVTNAITGAFGDAWNWISLHVFNPIGDFFSGLGTAISSTIGGVIGAIESPFKTAFDWIAHGWNDSIGAVSFTIPSWVPFIANDKFSMPKMPILDTGAMVTGSGLAYLHASEVIVNPQQQAEAMSGLMGGGSGAGGSGNVQLIFTGNYLLSNNAMTQFAQQVEQIVVTKLLPAGGRMVTL
jgi:hypothetical protein